LKKIVSKIYTQKPLQLIRQLQDSGEEINLVFPTADSLAVRLAGRCLRSGIKVKRICFRLSSSHKDTFRVEEIENHLKALIRMYPSSHISIGFETIPHKKNLIDFGFEESNLYWTPAPPETELVATKVAKKPLQIGFLGAARPNKGFAEIPRLIRSLVLSGVVFKAYVQQAVYPWPNYIHALNELEGHPEHVSILAANLSETELDKILGEIDVLVLPYSPEDYKLAGSGLLFEASDLLFISLGNKLADEF
jgi:glycosyltransferase involved in cell wall biosynthesis